MPNLTTPGSAAAHMSGDTPAMASYRSFAVPWIESDIHTRIKKMGPMESGALVGTPLIGLRDRKYIDHTATFRHRGPGDVMRYAALVSSADSADFGRHRILSDAPRRIPWRPPDELLYALVQCLYSMKPPPNPNSMDDKAAAGRKNLSVNTDPNLPMITRKGTGYYKIPSLKGVWYRGLYLHDAAVASLEDMFNPARLKDDATNSA